MRNFALAVLFSLSFVVGAAFAQSKTATLDSSKTVLNVIELRRDVDGGVLLTVNATIIDDATGAQLSGEQTCSVSSLTAGQRSALITVRNAALACWNAAEGF